MCKVFSRIVGPTCKAINHGNKAIKRIQNEIWILKTKWFNKKIYIIVELGFWNQAFGIICSPFLVKSVHTVAPRFYFYI